MATLGGLTALGVVLVAVLLGDITVGAESVSLVLQVPTQLGDIFGALLMLAVLSALSCAQVSHPVAVAAKSVATTAGGGGSMSINLLAVLRGAMLTIATPLVWAGIGEQVVEKTGVLNLGIEGTMYARSLHRLPRRAAAPGRPWWGLLTRPSSPASSRVW